MISVKKDYSDIPASLQIGELETLSPSARTTSIRRHEILEAGKYPDSCESRKYDSRYKSDDIKNKLREIYHGKCAYCETSVEQFDVEHFRPKRGGYYWLAYSWDNLLLSCPICNVAKGNSFPTSNAPVVYDKNRDVMGLFHHLSSVYDLLEKPLLVNPEVAETDIILSQVFNKQGHVFSENTRMAKTIEICKLDRKSLRERRKEIWDDLQREIQTIALLYENDELRFKEHLSRVLSSFKDKAEDPRKHYLAYRRFILQSNWIKELCQEVMCCNS